MLVNSLGKKFARTSVMGSAAGSAVVEKSPEAPAVATRSASIVPVLTAERQAPYLQYNYKTLDQIKPHHEMNFRKKPAGWAGWYRKDLADPFQAFVFRTPVRHIDRTLHGIHFGAGHISVQKIGYFNFNLKIISAPMIGMVLGLFCYWQRMQRNGWKWLNKSAVSGE